MTDILLASPGMGAVARPALTPTLASRSMWAIGTTCVVIVTEADQVDDALGLLAEDLSAIDRACSRFRPDSELRRIEHDGGGAPSPVTPLLMEALGAALTAAVRTAGIVDPTVGSALVELGYDRDFEEIAGGVDRQVVPPQPAPGWWQVRLDRAEMTVTIPPGIHVDLGATAKAFTADRSAERIAAALGCGVLVNLGGDIAVAGPAPLSGWPIGIAPQCTAGVDEVEETVVIHHGGLATSGTTARAWTANGVRVHHIIDPWTGEPAPPLWSLVSVAGSSCVEANAWSTAAVVWGADAVGNLDSMEVDARLVGEGGHIIRLGDWPRPDEGLDGAPRGDGMVS
jgi:thiamine biosynthesis lipoprotein